MDGRRKRGTAKHAGIVVYQRALPSGGVSWLARFHDPDTGRKRYETLPASLTTEEQRALWAVKKKRALEKREEALATGAPTKKGVSLEDAVNRYFENVKAGLRERTQDEYHDAADEFLAFAKSRGVLLGDDLRGEHLAELRSVVVNKRRRRVVRGGARYARKEETRVRSPATVNKTLRGIKTMLDHVRKLGLVPLVSSEAISDHLELVSLPKPVVSFLRPSELVKLIEAAGRHDRDTFTMTREEKGAGAKAGTPRYKPVLPYVATVLLAGMRADEARLLRWDAVDLAAAPAGQLVLRPEDVKTKHGRSVDLLVSPALRALLTKMRLRAGGEGYVFGNENEPITHATLEAARRRLVADFGAPAFSWQQLRATCGTFLANAPGIFGAASAYREAKQLGHSVAVAEKHYLGVVHVAPEARTLEAAMGIEEALARALGLRTDTPARARAAR